MEIATERGEEKLVNQSKVGRPLVMSVGGPGSPGNGRGGERKGEKRDGEAETVRRSEGEEVGER
eukprot:464062-Pleurochrysis_carterae.AAC.3